MKRARVTPTFMFAALPSRGGPSFGEHIKDLDEAGAVQRRENSRDIMVGPASRRLCSRPVNQELLQLQSAIFHGRRESGSLRSCVLTVEPRLQLSL